MDSEYGKESPDNYRATVTRSEDLGLLEAYLQNNPNTRVLLDYEAPVISRGWGETYGTEIDPVHVRSLGGATSYEGPNTAGIIQSGGCFEEDFQEWLVGLAEEIVPEDVYMDKKDPFLDMGRGRNDPKLIGFGAKMSETGTPNIYGASWRENPMTDEVRQIIEQDATAVLPEEIEHLTYNIEEETGQSFSEYLMPDEDPMTVEQLLEGQEPELEVSSGRSERRPTSCTVFWRPEEGYSIDRNKIETAVLPWQTS